jgi:hypothetical protein
MRHIRILLVLFGLAGTFACAAEARATDRSVQIVAPLRNSIRSHYGNVWLDENVRTPLANVSCQISWGDGTTAVVRASRLANGLWACGISHQYRAPGRIIIAVSATDDAGPVGSDSTQITVV